MASEIILSEAREKAGSLQKAATRCFICGCTEDNACLVDGVACGWAIPGELCDNTACIYESFARIAATDDPAGREEEPLVGLYSEGDLNLLLRERAEASNA